METDYSYQNKIALKILQDLKKDYSACLLAAYPGAGKTTISHIIINGFLKEHPKANVLVLTEGQNLLKNQYLSELKTPNVPINFTYGGVDEFNQVTVTIPQSSRRIMLSDIDLLVVDEAHHYYKASMVQAIIKEHNIKKIVLMTGTPSRFIKFNKMIEEVGIKEVKIRSISASELIEKGVYNNVVLSAVDCEEPNSANSIHNCIKKARERGFNLDKLMVACKTIKEAEKVTEILRNKYHRTVSLTTSANDPDNEYLDGFKKGHTNTLVVCNRGILGFNDSYLTCVIDLKDSFNVDNTNQLIARVLRKHPTSTKKKTYIRSCSPNEHSFSLNLLQLIVQLIDKDFYEKYDGDTSCLFQY